MCHSPALYNLDYRYAGVIPAPRECVCCPCCGRCACEEGTGEQACRQRVRVRSVRKGPMSAFREDEVLCDARDLEETGDV